MRRIGLKRDVLSATLLLGFLWRDMRIGVTYARTVQVNAIIMPKELI